MGKTHDFSIGSLNVRGLGDKVKRRGVMDWARSQAFDIILLQECYSTCDVVNQWSKEWDGICIFSHGTNHSKGVMILLKPGFDMDIKCQFVDELGRYIVIKILIQGKPYVLVNLYAPNTMRDKQLFFRTLCNKLDEMDVSINDELILGGDWNTIQNLHLDRKGGVGNINTKTESFTELLGQYDLIDIWRCKNENIKRFTYRRKTPLLFSRLDYYMVSNNMQDSIIAVDILPNIWSDHSAVLLTVKHSLNTKRGNSYWKFNSSLVEDNIYVEQLIHRIEHWKEQYESIQDKRVVWELIKYEIRKFTMSYCSQKKMDNKRSEEQKLRELKVLEVELERHPSDDKLSEVEQLRQDIELFERNRAKGAIVRSKVQWFEEGEKSTKFFFGLEKHNYLKKYIRKLKLENGLITTDDQRITEELKQFYSNLYKSTVTRRDLPAYLFPVDAIPKITDYDKEMCEELVTIEECLEALKTFKKNKSPGNDGLTVEFYISFWPTIASCLLDSYQWAFEMGELGVSQKQAIISLLAKPGKDREMVKNWRPISLLNVDYKIITKVMSLRLQNCLADLIHPNQSGFISDRYIGESIRSIQDIMAYTDKNKLSGLLLFIDFEKAFDSVEWPFLFKVLEYYNFGNVFRKWISIFYCNISSCVMNNGHTCGYFPLERGVRQGDPLSPYLFILAIEILAIHIRQDLTVSGFTLNRLTQKITMYADDITISVRDVKSAKQVFKIIDSFSRYSGLKINREKSDGMWIGSQKDNPSELFGIKWPKSPIKVLGVWVSHNNDSACIANFEDKIDKLRKQLHWWKARNLSLSGRIIIIKSIGISKFALLASLVHIPENIIRRVNTEIYNFVWNGKSDKVKRKIVVQDKENGGLDMIDFKHYVKACKCKWIKMYMNGNDATWKYMFEYFSEKENLGLFLRGNFETKELPKSLPLYYLDTIKSWLEIKVHSQELTDIIWYNKDIKIGNQSVYNDRLFKAGIWCVHDLYHNNAIVPFTVWQDRGVGQQEYMLWRGLVHRCKYKDLAAVVKTVNRGIFYVKGKAIDIDAATLKLIRECFVSKDLDSLKQGDYKARQKYCIKYGVISNEDWKDIFKCMHSLWLNNCVKDLQYKILYRFLPTNYLLFKMGKVASPACTFCGVSQETIEHFIYDCNNVKNFWIQVFEKWNYICPTLTILHDVKLVTFGMFRDFNEIERDAVNIIILLGKYFIWQCRFKGSIPSMTYFIMSLNRSIEVCKQKEPTNSFLNRYLELM